MVHVGGSGRYVEGERVFAPPSGVFDADWVAGIVVDREGARSGDRVELARAAQLAWDARGRGADGAGELAAVRAGGFDEPTAAAVCGAVADYVSAYGS
ncbi:hypothetical protein GTR02_19670 [Kineococcus sp. R8]|uniref:hypothetical protein n=1 Tax=Kineococcus siccus TaxID=2696567 RepID=UPI0014137432|nr:hypothetical protein [Kineococcus siccus]NAZ84031.1 hypothetical protein [Kineococcus siccus]